MPEPYAFPGLNHFIEAEAAKRGLAVSPGMVASQHHAKLLGMVLGQLADMPTASRPEAMQAAAYHLSALELTVDACQAAFDEAAANLAPPPPVGQRSDAEILADPDPAQSDPDPIPKRRKKDRDHPTSEDDGGPAAG